MIEKKLSNRFKKKYTILKKELLDRQTAIILRLDS